MKIAKEFKWEMGHRLKFHQGKCKHLHGHSYRMFVEVEGEQDKNGLVIDFYDLKSIIRPLIERVDHSCMVYSEDKELVDALNSINSRCVQVPFESTAENICIYFLEEISKSSLPGNINKIKVRIYETEEAYAEAEKSF